jgi:hypothetical protein
MSKDRESVRVLTTENWRRARRCRRSAGLYAGCWIEKRRDGRYRTYFYTARRDWDSLEDALAYANRDEGGVHIFFGDVPAGAPVETTYDPETDTTWVRAPDLDPRQLTKDEGT